MRRCACVTGMLLALVSASVQAQERTGPRLLLEAGGTRALSMGDVHAVGSIDSDAVFYAPAFADRLRGASLAVQWYERDATLYTASAAIDWFGGALALGLRAFDYSADLDQIPDSSLALEAPVDVAERAASLAFSRRVKFLRAGITGHLLEQRGAGENDVMYAVDVSVGAIVGPVSLALAGRNIGPTSQWLGRSVDPPTAIMLTASPGPTWPIGPLDILPVAAVSYDIAGGVRAGGGVEISYWPVTGRTFAVRGGVRDAGEDSPWTFGAGFTGDRIALDYAGAFSANDELIHRIGVRWR